MSQPITNIQQHLLDLVNARLQTELTLAQVDYAPLVLVDPTVLDLSVAGKRNTSTKISTKAGAEPSVDLDVTYNRLQLQKLFSLRSKEFADGNETGTHQLLPKLSARAGITITADDIVDEPIDRSGTAPFSVTIKAKPTSYLLFGELDCTVGEGSTGPVDPEPTGKTGFFLSNSMARGVTSDFATYESIPDSLAPVFGTNWQYVKTEAAVGDKAGRIWAFLGKNQWTTLHRTSNGGQVWRKDDLRNDEGPVQGNMQGYPDWKFTGRMLAYFKGAVYGYFIHAATNILWVCRLQEEDETGGVFNFQPIIALQNTFLPAIAADANTLAMTSEEPDDNKLSYEPTTWLHQSEDAVNWNRIKLFHEWSSSPEIVPEPQIRVHALAVYEGMVIGLGKCEWVDLAQSNKTREVYFEVGITGPGSYSMNIYPLDYWPNWQTQFPQATEAPGAGEFKHMAVVGNKVLIYIDRASINDDQGVPFDRYGIVLYRTIGNSDAEQGVVLQDSRISEGRIYDNGERIVISGKRADADGEFLAWTTDRETFGGWQYGTGTEDLFKDVDLTEQATYVTATAEGTAEPVYTPVIPPVNDMRYPSPSPADNIGSNTEVAAYVTHAVQQSDGKVLVAGPFANVAGANANRYLFRLKADRGPAVDPTARMPTLDTTFSPAFSASNTTINDLESVVVCQDNSILMAGSITRVGGVDFYGFARVAPNGGGATIWPQPELFSQYNDRNVNNAKLWVTPDGKVFLISATLRKVGVNDCYYIAKFNADGTVDGSWNNPMNPGGSLADIDFRSALMMPNGDLIVNQGGTKGYQPILIKSDGTVPASNAQPFKANQNCQIYKVYACPYTNGWIVYSSRTRLANPTYDYDLFTVERLTSDWKVDPAWNGRILEGSDESQSDGYGLVDLVPLSDQSGFMVAKRTAWWRDSNGNRFGHNRDVFVIDENGQLMPERLPLSCTNVKGILVDKANTGDSNTDGYLIYGQNAYVNIGEYPLATIVRQQNYVRTKVMPPEEVPQA